MSRMRTKLVRNLTRDERRRCQRLTQPGGEMQPQLARGDNNGGRVFMVEDDGRLLAWALVFECFNGTWAYFYTRKSCRRRGYGTRLYRAVKRHEADAKVCWIPGAET